MELSVDYFVESRSLCHPWEASPDPVILRVFLSNRNVQRETMPGSNGPYAEQDMRGDGYKRNIPPSDAIPDQLRSVLGTDKGDCGARQSGFGW
jgi:hypothetical protein